MKYRVFIALQLMLVLGCSPGANADDWTGKTALEEIRALIHWKAGRSQLSQRRDAIKAWLDKVEERGVELGEMGFVVGIAHYYLRDASTANRILIEYIRKYGGFPDSDYDRVIARVLLGTTGSAANSGDLATVELTLPLLLDLTGNSKLVYHRIGGSLRSAGGAGAHRLLNWLVRHLLDEPDFSDTEKQQVLEGMYGRARSSRTTRSAASRPQVLGPRPLRPFTATDLDGRKLSLSDYRGKVVLVAFWATWCGPYLLEMPNVVSVYGRYHEEGFEIIGISLDHAGAESRLRSTMKRFGMTWRQIYEGKSWYTTIALQNGVRRIPTTYLLDRTGKVRYTSVRGRALEEKVVELLKEESPPEGDDG